MRTVTHAYDLNNRRISRFVDEGLDFIAYGGSIENRDFKRRQRASRPDDSYKRRFQVSRPRWPNGENVALTLAQNMNVEHRYLHGPRVDQILADEARQAHWAPDEWQACESTGTFIDTYWTLTDHQGSVRDVLSAPGVRSEHIRYSAFGQIEGSNGESK